MRTLITVSLMCLLLAGCSVLPGSGSSGTLEAQDESYSIKLAPDWSVKDKGAELGRRIAVLAHKDAAESAKGYPTVIVREVHEPTPQGLLDFMARDQKLFFSELWNVGKDKYVQKQALLDQNGRMLAYWLAPVDGQGVEYYAAVVLTGFGRIEMIGVAQAGTVPKYMKDFNAMFTSLQLDSKSRFNPAQPGDTAAYLRGVYAKALTREQEGLRRLMSETAAWVTSGGSLSSQEKGFLTGTYVRATNKALEACLELAEAVGKPSGADAGAQFNRLADRLEGAATELETIQLNIRDEHAREAVEKSAGKARRMASLAREAAKLPQ